MQKEMGLGSQDDSLVTMLKVANVYACIIPAVPVFFFPLNADFHLSFLLQQRQQSREKNFNSFLSDLEAKYSKKSPKPQKGKKGKK